MVTALLFLVFVVSALTASGIIVRTFPTLLRLEIDEHPKLRESRTKHALLFGRWERRVRAGAEEFVAHVQPSIDALRRWVRWAAHQIIVLERRYGFSRTRAAASTAAGVDDVVHLLERATRDVDAGQLEHAEQAYIDVLRLDARNTEAYWGLVAVYRDRRADREALETLHFLVKLSPDDPDVWFELGNQAQRMGNIGDMFEAAMRAAALQSANPKYLDFLCEAAILTGHRAAALDAFRKLEAANPENQKLKEFRARIKEL